MAGALIPVLGSANCLVGHVPEHLALQLIAWAAAQVFLSASLSALRGFSASCLLVTVPPVLVACVGKGGVR